MKPKLTVAIPVYNGYPYIVTAVESILNQTLDNFKLLIVNDGSTDGTEQYLGDLEKSKPEIRVVHQKNKGLGRTRNDMLELIDTKYFVNLDADDYSCPERLLTLLEYMENNDQIGACGSFTEYFHLNPDNSGFSPPLPQNHIEIIEKLVKIQHGMVFPSLIIRTDVAKKTGGFVFDGSGEDWDFMLKLGKISKLANINKVLYKMRLHELSISWRNWGECRLKNQYASYYFLHSEKKEVQSFDKFKVEIFGNFRKRIWWETLTYFNSKFIVFYRKGIINGLAKKRISSLFYFMFATLCAPNKAFNRIVKFVICNL